MGSNRGIGPRKVECDAVAHELVALTGRLLETLPIEDRDLTPARFDQASAFQVAEDVCD